MQLPIAPISHPGTWLGLGLGLGLGVGLGLGLGLGLGSATPEPATQKQGACAHKVSSVDGAGPSAGGAEMEPPWRMWRGPNRLSL